MRVVGSESFQSLLRGLVGNGDESLFDATDRRAVYGNSVLWESSDDGVADSRGSCSESQTSSTADAVDGSGGDLSEAAAVVGEQGTPEIPVLASRFVRQSSESSVVDGYHVCADVAGIHVPGGRDRLAQPVCSFLAIVEQLGEQFLYGGVGGRLGIGMPRDIQYRSRSSIYEPAFHRSVGAGRCVDQHGWSWSSFGQCVCGAVVVEREARACLSPRSSDGHVVVPGVGYLPGVLQSEASSSESGVRDPVGRVPRKSHGEGTDGSSVENGVGGAAFGGSGSAPVRCAHLRGAAAPKRKSGSLAAAGLSN